MANHHHTILVCQDHGNIVSQCRCISERKVKQSVPCPGMSCASRKPPGKPDWRWVAGQMADALDIEQAKAIYEEARNADDR